MNFRSIVYSALFAGLLSGLLLTAIQQWQVTPIIIAAEVFESPEPAAHHEHAADIAAHHHEAAWAPADGLERLAFTGLSNFLTASGFALVIIALMNLKPIRHWYQGAIWGVAGYLTFFVAPALGLHPEIPGMQAAALESRQFWWTLCVSLTALGLAVIAFSPVKLKLTGPVLIALPHIIGAPEIEGPLFAASDPNTLIQLEILASQFIPATAFANGIYWLALGLISALMVQRGLKGMQN